MEEVIVGKDNDVKLFVKISSDANVGSNVSLNDTIVKKSGMYSFNVDLGNSNNLDNKKLSIGSNFFVSDGNIDAILRNTSVTCILKFGDEAKEFTCEKVKITEGFFIAFLVINFIN